MSPFGVITALAFSLNHRLLGSTFDQHKSYHSKDHGVLSDGFVCVQCVPHMSVTNWTSLLIFCY